jgi:hypothetical protein
MSFFGNLWSGISGIFGGKEETKEEEEEKVKLNENIIKTTKQQQEKVENMENIISAKIKDWNNCSTNSTTSKSSKKAAHIQNKIELAIWYQI